MEVNGQLHTLVTKGVNCKYRLNRRLGGPQSHCEHFGEEKSVLYLLEIEVCLVPLPTILSQLFILKVLNTFMESGE
jgi:hypothetical protein